MLAGVLVIFLAGYLLIYNVFYISIAQDIRFYGMLKTLGTTARQIRRIVYSFILSSLASVTVVRIMGAGLSYFTWHFTLLPVILCVIPLIVVTGLIPFLCYKKLAQKTVVERLRTAE